MSDAIKIMSDNEMKNIVGGAYSGSVFLYTVQEGDTLSVLAHRFGTSVALISELNNIKTLKSVYPGVKLLIPLKG